MPGSLKIVGKRPVARLIQECVQTGVARNAGSEALTVSLPQGSDESVAAFLTGRTGYIAFAIVEGEAPIPLPLAFPSALADSFLWHVYSYPIVANWGSQLESLR